MRKTKLNDENLIRLLLGKLKDADSELRINLIGALGSTQRYTLIKDISFFMKDRSAEVRRAAANEILYLIKSSRENDVHDKFKLTEMLVCSLNDSDFRVGSTSAEALGVLKDEAAITSLTGQLQKIASEGKTSTKNLKRRSCLSPLNHEDSYLASKIADALGEIGHISALGPLLEFATFERSNCEIARVIGRAEQQLSKLSPESEVSTVMERNLSSNNPSLQQIALNYFKEIHTPNVLNKIVKLSNECSPSLAFDIVECLSAYKVQKHLLPFVYNQNLGIREKAIRALGGAKETSTVDLLTEFLNEDSPAIRRASLIALGETVREEALPQIESLLNDPDASVRLEAATVFAKVGKVQPLIDILRSDEYEDNRDEAAERVIEYSHSQTVFEALVAGLKDEAIRYQAIESLGKLGEVSAFEHIEKHLNDPDEMVRINSIIALAKLDIKRACRHLISALNGMGAEQQEAAYYLGESGLEHALNPLVKQYETAHCDELISVLTHAIGKLNRSDLFVNYLQSKNENLHYRALESLLICDPEKGIPYAIRGLNSSSKKDVSRTIKILKKLKVAHEGPQYDIQT